MGKETYPVCTKNTDEECFAREHGKCSLLMSMPKEKSCGFCKPKRTVTDGKEYPWDSDYSKR